MNLFCCCVRKTMAPNTRVTRKWELFAGRNKFYCDGLLMSAPHTGVFYLTCVLITGTSALFFAFDCPHLAREITPAIPIVGALLYFFTMSSLLRTTFTDPGVIPRASHDEAAYIEKQIEVPNSLNSPTYRPPPRTKEVLVKGQTVKLKYCFTCKIFRPPRASHCSLCDNCVDRFDHHCPWVGNCVGKRNYRFFYMFLVSLAFLAVFIFSCSITHLVLLMKVEQEVFIVIKKAPFSVIVTAICFFSIWSVIGLAGFHTYLTTSDQTTNEDLKGSFSSKGGQRTINPYSRGNICLNCFHILCGPMTPSLIDRRGIATDEYILQMQQQSCQSHPRIPLTTVDIQQTSMIMQQPMMSADGELKPRLYDESNPSSMGVYRPRSYDNLQNGNSNSLAQLVDNEIPLSNMEVVSPVSGPSNTGGFLTAKSSSIMLPTSISNDDEDVNDEDGNESADNNVESRRHIKIKHNMSGSYNNLFRDNLDNSLTVTTTDTTIEINGVPDVYNLMKSASESENVYSNIPSQSNDSDSDPSLHVYSNLIEERQNIRQYKSPSKETISKAETTADIMSSTLLSDDLDLDDPVAAFVVNSRKKVTPTNKANIKKNLESEKDSAGINGHDVQQSHLSPNRLRLLHDTTMIDTALDLDSLDGSSVGNNSQICLVKTAIV